MGLTADDLWPLIEKLPRAERLKLARLALSRTVLPAAATDSQRYAACPARPDEFSDVLAEVIVAPATRTVRGLATEVPVGPDDGMPTECVLNFDHVALARKDRIGGRICTLPDGRWTEVRAALLAACGFD
jgi:mRNA interferase MazF